LIAIEGAGEAMLLTHAAEVRAVIPEFVRGRAAG